MKRFIVIIMMCVMACALMGLAGCGQDEATSETAEVTTTEASTSEETTIASQETEAETDTGTENANSTESDEIEITTADSSNRVPQSITERAARAADGVVETTTEEVTETATSATNTTSVVITEISTADITETATEEVTEVTTEVTTEEVTEVTIETINTETDSKVLVAYFSWSGNTKEMAEYIAEQTGGELYEIEPETPYSDVYEEVGEQAEKERDDNARPAIGNLPESIDEYDAIFVGYPIWWHTAPMIIGTFLESYDMTDVEIYPFTQSASMDTEQFENSMDFVRENAAGANVHDGLFVDSTDTDGISSYLRANGFVE